MSNSKIVIARSHYLFLLFLLFSFVHCSSVPKKKITTETAALTSTEMFQKSEHYAILTRKAATIPEKIKLSNKGIAIANDCIKKFPSEPGCYFFRAVNTGLYYKTTLMGYQKGLKSMIEDCLKTIKLDPSFDEGGAYLLIGNIYFKAPAFTLSKKAIRQDLEKAFHYAQKAININSTDTGNQLLLAEILVERGEFEKAQPLLKSLVKTMPSKKDKTFDDKSDFKLVIKLLKKVEKELTK